MDIHKTFINTQILTISICLLAPLLVIGQESSARPDDPPKIESVAKKIAAHIAEEAFWGFIPIKRGAELKVILLVANDRSKAPDFDVLAIVPEINETLIIQRCDERATLIMQGRGNSEAAKVKPESYLRNEVNRFRDFVANATKSEKPVLITADPSALFNSDPAFRMKRIGQIKAALAELVHQRPLKIRVANFSRLTDQIDVLVPALGKMYTMSVVHKSCSEESVEVGKEFSLKSVRADLRKKILLYSTADVIESNPVRAGIVERAADYPWSSASAHLLREDKSGMLDMAIGRQSGTDGTFSGILSPMARWPRVIAVGFPHHVTQRGNTRQFILASDDVLFPQSN